MTFPTVCAPISLADGSALLVLPLVNGFHGLPAVLLSRGQCIARSSARKWLSVFARRISQRMAADSLFFRSSMPFMVCALFCSADDCALHILPLVKGFHQGLCAVLLCGWQRIANSSTRQRIAHISPSQRLSRWFPRRIAHWMTADCSHIRWSKSVTVCALNCSMNGSRLLIPPLVNSFPDGSHAVLLSGQQLIVHIPLKGDKRHP